MYDLKAYAFRKDGVIYVTVSGNLPNSCYTAEIVDKYPGGNIVYIRDPGSAQVFIDEFLKPNSGVCLMVLVPWVSHVSIVDDVYNHVAIFVNGDPVEKVEVNDEPKEFRVIALTASEVEGFKGCSVIPSNAVYPAIYNSVYGPNSKAECDEWLKENCVKLMGSDWSFPLGLSGDGTGEFPHGNK